MEYKYLGNSKNQLSRIGFGCWAIGGHGYGNISDEESISAVQHALDLGINFFDTADVYGFGHSEEILSKALGNKRHEIFIATKFGVAWDENGKTKKDCSPKYAVKALEASLKRLRIDTIPLYQIHWPDGTTNLDDTLDVLERCQKEGKIKYIGCSNFSSEILESIKNRSKIVSNQSNFNLIERQSYKDIKKYHEDFEINNIVYGVLARGLLSGKYNSNTIFSYNDTRAKDSNFKGQKYKENHKVIELLLGLSKKYEKSASQIAIRWILQNPCIDFVLLGITKTFQVEENIGVFNWALSHEDFHKLSDINNNSKLK